MQRLNPKDKSRLNKFIDEIKLHPPMELAVKAKLSGDDKEF